MNENDDLYKKFSYSSKNNNSFGLSVLLPFVSGILSTILVLGIAFGVPSIKEKILGVEIASTSTNNDSTPTLNLGNLDQVSLTNFSDTAVGAANKVLPSIVGISVEYDVTSSSSFLSPSETSRGAAEGSRNNYKRRWIYSNK